MTDSTTLAPITAAIEVAAPPERAYAAFTTEFGTWWPHDYAIGGQPPQEVVLEARPGGRWFERAADGTECDWGYVIAAEPPTRLVLAWQITADFRHDPDLVTEVEVRFVPSGTGTRVELEHRDLERYGERAAQIRQVLGGDSGWNGILRRFAAILG